MSSYENFDQPDRDRVRTRDELRFRSQARADEHSSFQPRAGFLARVRELTFAALR